MSLARKISAANRNRKWDIFLREISPNAKLRVLDVGFSENEYSPTDNYIEKYYPYPEMLTALGVNTPNVFKERYPKVKAFQYDGAVFPFGDKEFDVCWSNAVIEHVGNFDRQQFFLSEIKRVASKAFLTTPNSFFPIEVHTRTPLLHYLPKGIFDSYLKLIGKSWAAGTYMNLLSITDIKDLLAGAGIKDYRIIPNKLLGFTMDFIIIF
ncbi:MAG: class I SAM-dependent methyltransferase [Candidatus Kuenenia stuttgartiensis]|nr:class I SAM-dependent methyltransferase [Candidatus Kuenenia stuttgartiensis]